MSEIRAGQETRNPYEYISLDSLLRGNPFLGPNDPELVVSIVMKLSGTERIKVESLWLDYACDAFSAYVRGSVAREALCGPPQNTFYWQTPLLMRAILDKHSQKAIRNLAEGPDLDFIIPQMPKNCPRSDIAVVGGDSIVRLEPRLTFFGMVVDPYILTDPLTGKFKYRVHCIQREENDPMISGNPDWIRNGSRKGVDLEESWVTPLCYKDGKVCLRLPKMRAGFPKNMRIYGLPSSSGREAYLFIRGFTQFASYNLFPKNTLEIGERFNKSKDPHVLSFSCGYEKDRVLPFLVQDSVLAMLLAPDGFTQFLTETGLLKLFPIADPEKFQESLLIVSALHELMEEAELKDDRKQYATTLTNRLIELLAPCVSVIVRRKK